MTPRPAARPPRPPRRTRVVGLAVVAVLALGLGLANSRAQRPLDAQARLGRGEARLARGDAAGAQADFEAALRLAPRDYEPYNGLARALEALGRRREALAANESVLAVGERQGWRRVERDLAWRNFALGCYRLDDLERGLPALEKLHAEGGSTLQTDLRLGIAYLLRGDTARAAAVQAAARRRWGDLDAVWRLGCVVGAAAPGPVSRAVLEAACGVRADRDAVLAAQARGESPGLVAVALGEISMLSGEVQAAQAWLTSVPASPLAPLRDLLLAQAALRGDDGAAALVHLQRAAADPELPAETLNYHTAQALHLLGRDAEARAALGRAAAANPLATRGDVLLGRLAAAGGDTGAALAAYRRVLEVDARHAEANFEVGSRLAAAGDPRQGQVYLQRYLQLEPQGEHAAAARRLLAGR